MTNRYYWHEMCREGPGFTIALDLLDASLLNNKFFIRVSSFCFFQPVLIVNEVKVGKYKQRQSLALASENILVSVHQHFYV